jgi:hypothetical protein
VCQRVLTSGLPHTRTVAIYCTAYERGQRGVVNAEWYGCYSTYQTLRVTTHVSDGKRYMSDVMRRSGVRWKGPTVMSTRTVLYYIVYLNTSNVSPINHHTPMYAEAKF